MASTEATARDLDSEYEADLTDISSVSIASDEEEIRQNILLQAASEANEGEDSENAMALDNHVPDDTDNSHGTVEDGVRAAACADVDMHPIHGEGVDNTRIAARNDEFSAADAEEKPKDFVSGSDRARSPTLAGTGRHRMRPSTA